MKPLAIATILAACAIAPAQTASVLRYSAYYDFKAKQTVPIVGVTVGSLPRLFGSSKLNAEVWAYAGLEASRPAAGFAFMLPYQFSVNSTAYIGLAVSTTADKPVGGAPAFGFAFRF